MLKHLIIKGYNALLGLNMLGVNRPVCLYISLSYVNKTKKHTFFNYRYTFIVYDVPIVVL